MQTVSSQLFTGYKGVRLEDLPEEAWRIVVGDGGRDAAERLYATVPWLYRAVDIRAGAVAGMPWEIRQGDRVLMTQEDDPPEKFEWLADLPALFYRTEASLLLTGRAYWFRERNLLRTLAVRWVRPDSVKPLLSRDGLSGFTRAIDGRDDAYEVDDFVYFWLPGPFAEIGPPRAWPGKAAMSAAGVLSNMDLFLSGYFERGMIKATLLTYTQSISKDEGDRVKEWWGRVVTGVKNAFATLILRGDFKPVVIGEGLHDLQNTALTAEQRESICAAFGVPQSKMMANAANYATKVGDDRSFIEDTIAPECSWLADTINRQLLKPMGLRLVFKPQELSVMQVDETQRASSLKLLVDAGMSLEMALAVLGYDLPEGIELREPKAETPPQLMPFTRQQANTAEGNNTEHIEETRRFQRWAKKRAHPDPDQFESLILSRSEKIALLEGGTAADAPFRGHEDWSDQEYP